MSFNTFKSKTKKIGGSHHIWHEVNRTLISGGTLEKPLPAVGTVIPAGTPVNISEAGGTAKLLEVFEISANVAAADTEVKIAAGAGLPIVSVGQFLMPVPSSVTGTGKGIEITQVDYDNTNGVYVLTITANDFGALKVGDLLVNADKAGTGAKLYTIPNALTWNDVYIEDGTTAASVSGVVSGIIYADRITPVPDVVKMILPQITFQKGI